MQSGIILALVLLSIGLSIYLFYLNSSRNDINKDVKSADYLQDYASSMLTSLLRSSTGNPLAGCERVRDILIKAYNVPLDGKCCGISDKTCRDYVRGIVTKKIDTLIANAKENYLYYFEFGKEYSSQPLILSYPSQNAGIKDCKCEKIVVEQKLISSQQLVSYPYARLYVVEKDSFE